SEAAAHFALLEHPAPQVVLLIGGGVGGLLEEIARHSLAKIDYIELDPLIVKLAQQHLPVEYKKALDDERVSTIFMDARYYIKTTSAARYDVIIVNLGAPSTAQINRFYTLEFFKEAKAVMKKGGLLSLGLSSSESYIGRELAEFLGSIYATLKSVFGEVKVLPGETSYFLASDDNSSLTYDFNILMQRAKLRNLDLKYVREYYLFSRLSPQNISYTDNTIKSASLGSRINSDFYPISYYYDILFWTTRFKGSLFSAFLKAITAKFIWLFAICGCCLILVFGLVGTRKKEDFARSVIPTVAVNGFSQMTFQIIILLAFQILYGYLFYKLGIIITAYMTGLATGGWLGTRVTPKLRSGENALMVVPALLFLFALLLPWLFGHLTTAIGNISSWVGTDIVFTILPFLSGAIGGFLFPVANNILLDKESS
ncbi:MAG: hypothetical protein NC933_05445, partial [Candidatus Omnitrophica bacterium]|nr:hypothetical protein [Candidatus Omnitrophota bacterium]